MIYQTLENRNLKMNGHELDIINILKEISPSGMRNSNLQYTHKDIQQNKSVCRSHTVSISTDKGSTLSRSRECVPFSTDTEKGHFALEAAAVPACQPSLAMFWQC